MKDLFIVLQEFFTQSGWHTLAGILSLIVTFFGAFQAVWTLCRTLWNSARQRKLQRDLHPFYTTDEIQRATQYYVATKCQNVAPSKAEEPRRGYAFAARENTIPFFLKKAFKQDDCQFYIILADSGMGKTTFLINLYLRYLNQFFRSKYRIKLFPLGWPDIEQEIEHISKEEQKNTILLLDAFDEDIQVIENYQLRLKNLIQKIKYFREVVITCRTQFFPTEEEEPKETDVRRYGGEGGDRVFYKLYLSPFDDKDIRTYLRKRFAWFQFRKKRKAQQIVQHSPNLMVRPMLLNYIEDLLQAEREYSSPYIVYAELIERWIQREAQKVSSEKRKHYREELFKFSHEIARNIYEQREKRQGALMIPGEEIQIFADKHDIRLSEMEMKSRSLLNRNAQGHYKFSHKSILEYFLAEEAFFNKDFRQKLDFEGMDVAEDFLRDMAMERLTIPFFSREDLIGEYRLNSGKTRALTALDKNLIVQMTHLSLKTWEKDNDSLLLKGLPHLKVLRIDTNLSAEQFHELQRILPTCPITCSMDQDEIRNAFGLSSQKITINNSNYNFLRPIEYTANQYEKQKQGEVVVDRATGLMWQQSGSKDYITYEKALQYVEELNRQKFAGCTDWRLPTIPELMTLLEPERQSNDLFIAPVFDEKQLWCWSANKCTQGTGSSGSAWFVHFSNGGVSWSSFQYSSYVRCVRS